MKNNITNMKRFKCPGWWIPVVAFFIGIKRRKKVQKVFYFSELQKIQMNSNPEFSRLAVYRRTFEGKEFTEVREVTAGRSNWPDDVIVGLGDYSQTKYETYDPNEIKIPNLRRKMKPVKVGNRGFSRYEFKDIYGSHCSIQDSSRANEACVWLGVDQDWQGNSSTRMHLNVDQAKELVEALNRFIETESVRQ